MKTAFPVTSANIPYDDCLRFVFAVVWQWTESHQVTNTLNTLLTQLHLTNAN